MKFFNYVKKLRLGFITATFVVRHTAQLAIRYACHTDRVKRVECISRLHCARGAPLKAVRGCLFSQTIPQSPSVPAPFAQGSLTRLYLYQPKRQHSCQFTHRRCDSRRKPIHAQRAIHFTTVAFSPYPALSDTSAGSVSPSSPPQAISRRTLRATNRG